LPDGEDPILIARMLEAVRRIADEKALGTQKYPVREVDARR
jgi:hypothetical protein